MRRKDATDSSLVLIIRFRGARLSSVAMRGKPAKLEGNKSLLWPKETTVREKKSRSRKRRSQSPRRRFPVGHPDGADAECAAASRAELDGWIFRVV